MEVREGQRGESGECPWSPLHTPRCARLSVPRRFGLDPSTPQDWAWGCLCPTPSSPPGLGLGVFVSRSLSTSRTGHCGVPNLQSPQPLCSPETWVSPVLTPRLLWGISAVTVVAVPCPAQSCAPVLWGFNTHC